MILNDMPDLRDACPVCPPGFPAAALPAGPVTEANGGRLADYQCPACAAAWSTWWDRFGWPIERLIAPVAPEDATRHRDGLDAELRERAA